MFIMITLSDTRSIELNSSVTCKSVHFSTSNVANERLHKSRSRKVVGDCVAYVGFVLVTLTTGILHRVHVAVLLAAASLTVQRVNGLCNL
jgi:hypothetical protein